MENLTPEKAKWLAERYYKPDNSAVVFSEWKSGAISARTASKQPGWLERPSANGSTKVWLKKSTPFPSA